MTSVKERLKAELVSSQPGASSSAKEAPPPEPETEEKAKLQVFKLIVLYPGNQSVSVIYYDGPKFLSNPPTTHCIFHSNTLFRKVLVSALSEEQLDRYEAFRRSKFPQSMMRKMVHGMTGVMPSSNCCIALSGEILINFLIVYFCRSYNGHQLSTLFFYSCFYFFILFFIIF